MASSSLVQRPQPPETPEIIQQVLQGGWESGMPSSPVQRPQPPETPEIIQQVLQGDWESGMPSSPVQRPQPPETPEIIQQVLQATWEPGEPSSPVQRPQPPETPDIIRQAVQGTWRPDMASSNPIQRPTFLAAQEITWSGGARKRPTSQDSSDRREAMLMPTPAKIPRQRTRTSRKYEKVTDALLMKCKALSGEQIENEGGIAGLARKYNVAWETLRKYVCVSGGLKSPGQERLDRHKKKEVSDAMLKEWENLSQEQRDNEGGLRGFAKKHNVRFEALSAYALVSGGLNQRGDDRLHKDERAPLTNAMLVEWENLSREQIMDVGGLSGFAEKHNVSVKKLSVYAREYGGLSPEGKDRVYRHKKNPVTKATLEQWKALNKKQIAKRGSVRRFANKHNVSIFVLRQYVCASGGLTPRGKAKLAKLAKKDPSSA
ncbi:hypothetical protein PI93_019620 [Pandoraea fibrosis]|uniref:HTH psq-type domain-containing protein n=1 Tax=Pandoraea fibrosis TaxID=1891094 RepID=A0ABX6HVS2_9BURK|nr:hypothetical protein [Pandoraea fibrosis]QHE91823.1 hypothetical protein PJ20_008380 [Pandoraea fibrosis]QHF14619.1 hypothetical protein PI93_019620 [Pandoraea fibrosis]